MQNHSKSFLTIATSRRVVHRAVRISAFVGTVLAIINHGDSLLELDVSMKQMFQIILTYLVPYGVATYTSAKTIQGSE
jgi:hypothetical protein